MKLYDLIDEMARQHKTIFDMPLRVTFYARVSTKRDAQLNSQENQVTTFTDMITNNVNWTLVPGYIDTIRGESAANRDSFLQMIEDAKNDTFDLIICKEISRFSRDILDSISYTRELLRHDVGVYFSSDGLCTIDRDAELRLGIMASIAQQEVARLSERVKFGHHKAIENGVVLGNSRIIGYKKDNKKLVIDPEEAEMVKLIFSLFSTGQYSLRQLESILYEKGYRSLAGGTIRHNTIKSILQNPKYKGYYCGNKVHVVDYRTKKQKFLPESEWVMFKDETGLVVPAIVDEELWNKCNQLLTGRLKDYQGNVGGVRKTSPLSGLLKCGHCGCSFYHTSYGHGTNLGVRYQWICRDKKAKADSCPTFTIYDDELYSILSDFFLSLSGNINEYIDEYLRLFDEMTSNLSSSKEYERLETQLETHRRRKEKLLELYTEELIDKEAFVKQSSKITEDINQVQAELDSLESQHSGTKDLVTRMDELKRFFSRELTTEDSRLPNATIESLCSTLVSRITIKSNDKTSMKLFVEMKVSNQNTSNTCGQDQGDEPVLIVKSGQSSGHIFLDMKPIVTQNFSRSNVKGEQVTYILYINFC